MTKIVALKAFSDNYIWAILDDEHPCFACVDPGDAAPVLNFADHTTRKLSHILLTHHHDDHIGGVHQLLEAFPDCQVYGPDDPRIDHCQSVKSLMLFSVFFEVLQTPGHTRSHISYHAPEKGWLFCGDTLFSAGCGRVFDGSMEQLHHSIQVFKALPNETLVYAAHEYTRKNLEFAHFADPENRKIAEQLEVLAGEVRCTLPSTIAFEKEVNPFFRTDQAAIQAFALQKGATSHESLDVFSAVRKAKDVY